MRRRAGVAALTAGAVVVAAVLRAPSTDASPITRGAGSTEGEFPRAGTLVFDCSDCALGRDGVYSIAPNGHGVRFLAGSAGGSSPRRSRDGRTIMYTVSRQGEPIEARAGLWLGRSDGSYRRRVAQAGVAAGWSPRGTLVFLSDGGVFMAGISRPRPLLRLPPTLRDLREPDLSPDGRRIIGSRGFDAARLWLIEVAGSDVRRIGPRWLSGERPRWSPDGRRVAFVDSNAGSVNILALRTGRIRTIFAGAWQGEQSLAAAWSPDGRWLAVAGWVESEPDEPCDDPTAAICATSGLWIVNAADGRSKLILRFEYLSFVSGLDWKLH